MKYRFTFHSDERLLWKRPVSSLNFRQFPHLLAYYRSRSSTILWWAKHMHQVDYRGGTKSEMLMGFETIIYRLRKVDKAGIWTIYVRRLVHLVILYFEMFLHSQHLPVDAVRLRNFWLSAVLLCFQCTSLPPPIKFASEILLGKTQTFSLWINIDWGGRGEKRKVFALRKERS